MKISALVQTRMGSTRLPGKVMMEINGKPVLWHVVTRLKRAKLLDRVLIVTTTSPQDDAVENFCSAESIGCFRGSEEDVLDRYHQAAIRFNVDRIVRITADCPLIDPKIVDAVIRKHRDSGSDYTSNTLTRTFPRGMDTEIFTAKALEKAHREAVEASEREHVTPYFYRHPEIFRLASVEARGEQCRPDIRICVDTPEDLALIRRIFQEFGSRAPDLAGIVRLFSQKPELLDMNASIKQKAL